jgi:hypothetical protein
MVLFEAPENIDMIVCLKDIAAVYAADAEDVPKVGCSLPIPRFFPRLSHHMTAPQIVIESLRHLDTAIVLALVKARSDFNKGNASWTKKLSDAFGTIKWDAALPWESKKINTIVAFAESAAAGSSSQSLGPSTLRKTSVPITSLMIAEYARAGADHDPAASAAMASGLGFSDSAGNSSSTNLEATSSSAMSSSFAPNRPGSINYGQANQLLMTFGSNDTPLNPALTQHNADMIDFVNRNTLISSIDAKKDPSGAGAGIKQILHKVQDSASTMKESASHLVANVKHAVEHPKFDRDTVRNIFTSPQTGQLFHK